MKISTKSMDALFFYTVLADILFFPYIRFLGISLSMLLVPLWFLVRFNKIYLDREDLLCFIAIFIAIISLLIGTLVYSDGILLRDGSFSKPFSAFLPNTVIIIFSFLYFIFFKRLILKYRFKINKIIFIYLFFLVSLNTVYFYSQSLFFEIRALWTLSNNVIEVTDIEGIYRFTSTFSDPNNFSVIANAVLAFVLMSEDIKKYYKLLSIPLVFYLLVGSMSNTGFILFSIVLLAFFVKTNFFEIKSKKSIINSFILSSLVILVFIAFVNYIGQTRIGSEAFNRVESNSIDSRIDIWDRVIDVNKILSSALYGDGGLAVIGNQVINPHTGHLHLIYSYGFVFYIIFMSIFFRKRKNKSYFQQLFVICLFLGFTVNVGVYELRFVGVMAILTASLYMKKYDIKGFVSNENRSYNRRIQ